MKSLLILLLALTAINCSKVKFTNDQIDQIEEVIDQGIDLGGENVDDEDDDGIDDDVDDEVICPRYDLVVKSTHENTKKLNYLFTFNGETKHNSTEGEIDVIFLKDGAKKFTQCSGSYTNTTMNPNLKPLKAVEGLTSEIVINHGVSCLAVVPERTTRIQVIDNATNKILWDEQELIDFVGSCEFGYTEEGMELRNKILGLADGVVNAMAATCNK
jgi:hypothetical protein